MKKIEREKLIIESFAKTFNKIKRLDEQEIDEINLAKSVASLGLATALAGTPNHATAQGVSTKTIEYPKMDMDVDNLSQMSDEKAGVTLLMSYTKNPFTAETWGQQSKDNIKLFKTLKKMMEYRMQTGRFEQEDLIKLGAKYKIIPIGQQFINRDTKDKSTFTMKENI